MNYFRSIIYLYEYDDSGIRGRNAGFVKLSKKETRLKLEIRLSGDETLAGERVYLLDKDKNAVNKVLFGTITEEGPDVVMTRNTSETGMLKGELAGVIIGGEGYAVYAGEDNEAIRVMDYVGAERDKAKSRVERTDEAGGEAGHMQRKDEAKEEVAEEREEPVSADGEETEEPEGEGEIIQIELEEEHDAEYMFRKMFATHPNMYPFEDDEMEACVQISPGDFSAFPKEYWHMGSNTFLLQGYYNYRHLILARTGKRFYVGIPGQYHRRDKYLADMFGFGHFKCIQKKPERLGDFGYWMQEVQQPITAI